MKNELAEIESPGPNSTALERQYTSEMWITVNTLGLKWPIFTSLGKQASIFQLKHRLHLLATLRAVLCISAAWLSWYWGRENELSPVQSKWASIVMWLWVTVADSAVTGYKWKRKKKKKRTGNLGWLGVGNTSCCSRWSTPGDTTVLFVTVPFSFSINAPHGPIYYPTWFLKALFPITNATQDCLIISA